MATFLPFIEIASQSEKVTSAQSGRTAVQWRTSLLLGGDALEVASMKKSPS